jgi:DNA polymerase III subunit delta'
MAFLPADILERLRRACTAGRLPHAMLISGSAGSGRAELAMNIAGLVNGTDATGATLHPDVHKLEPESKSRRILVEPFRQFCEPFFSTSFRPGATKTGIILEADRLHPNAANAFLKTLEEPPANTLFILVTSNPGQLPVTIVSRCAHFPLRDARLPALEGPAAEIADATGEILSSAPSSRTGAALRLARRLQRLLREAREHVEEELTAAFKAEKKRLGDTAEEEWLKEEEARLKALVEARVLATRQHLASVVAERTADVLRARHGVATLQFPALEAESRRLAAQFDDATLLRVLDGAARLRLFLDRNLKEDLALEAGCLALVRS